MLASSLRMGTHARTLAIAGICAAFVLVGAAAEVVLFPRVLPTLTRFRDPSPQGMTQPQLEALLGHVARSLKPDLRARLAEAVLSESTRAGYDPLFVLALVSVESGFRPLVSSERGAYGLMQLKPSTFAWIAGRERDLDDAAAVAEDPVLDVRMAVRYFHWLNKRFRNRDEALMAYNAGPGRMQQFKRTQIPASVREYARKVNREHQRFTRLAASAVQPGGEMLARAN